MKKFVILVFVAALTGCVDEPGTKAWGQLPRMSTYDRGKCKNVSYPNRVLSRIDDAEPLYPQVKRGVNIAHWMYLGNTCFIASIMMSEYESPADQIYNHYTIDVEVPHLDSRCAGKNKPDICQKNPIAYAVLFQRELLPEEVGEYFRNKRMEDVISFDERTNIVRFNTGNRFYEYRLPDL